MPQNNFWNKAEHFYRPIHIFPPWNLANQTQKKHLKEKWVLNNISCWESSKSLNFELIMSPAEVNCEMNRDIFPSFFLFNQTKPAGVALISRSFFNLIALIAAINFKPNNASLWHQSFFTRCLVFLSPRNSALVFTKASGDLLLFTLDFQTASTQKACRRNTDILKVNSTHQSLFCKEL